MEKNVFEKYITWDNIRWIFPLIFAAIMSSHLYGYFFPARHKMRFDGPAPPRDTKNPRPIQTSISMVEPTSDEAAIENEFRLLCEFLLTQAFRDNRIPPVRLSEALEGVRNTWSRKQFENSFRLIIQKADPWGQPYVYRVNEGARTISLQSFGPDGIDNDTKGDDIHVIRNYRLEGSR
jgi:hypothetical protein